MKNRFYQALFFATMMLSLLPLTAQAGNDYLQQFDNYTVMSMGNNVLRFTIPVWIYGQGDDNTYYLNPHSANSNDTNDSYLWYSEVNGDSRGSATVHRIVSFGGTRNSNYDERRAGGVGYAYALVDAGSCVITNTYNGVPLTLTAGDSTHWIIGDNDGMSVANRIEVTRMNSYYGKHHVYLQIDWYMPQELQSKNFYIGLNVRDYYVKNNNPHNAYWWQWGSQFYGGDIPQSPQLFDPYFYSVAGDGVGSLGMAAMQYMTYHDPISYHTSLHPDQEQLVTERSGSVLVEMQDTVQDYFSADFNVWINKDAAQSQRLTSNHVLIPAYHKIYNFAASEVRNAQNSVTGDVDVFWKTRHPEAQDILEMDVFEVQRATKEDFSDAQTIGLLPLVDDDSIYQITDLASDVLALLKQDSLYERDLQRVSVTEYNIESGEESGFHARYDATLYSDMLMPGIPLYYRVRRASAASWGWYESPYMAKTSLVKTNYLAPLASEQTPYTLDPDFENNRKVHFYIRLDNAEFVEDIPSIDETSLAYAVDPSSVYGVAVPVKIAHTTTLNGLTFTVKQTFNGVETQIPHIINGRNLEINALAGSTVRVEVSAGSLKKSISFSVPARGKTVQANLVHYTNIVKNLDYSIQSEENNLISEEELSELVRPFTDTAAIKAQLYPVLLNKLQPAEPGGRCIWDRNADLVLVRRIIETGTTYEIRVPKDSIIMQQDGSYLAHMTDVANLSCSHYAYAVRIDQTNAVLQVQQPSQLDPVVITGPDLYTNTSADIASFEATDGTDKRGVILTWQPTAGSIDYYMLERRAQAGSATFDTLAVLDTEGYFDEHTDEHPVVPGRAYEYRLTTHYTCNGFSTVHTATAVGSRSPYGSIAGRVAYADGSGCYGVQVALSSEGAADITTLTDETGAFLFDSLLYGTATTYSITPVSQTAEFRFNNTSSPTATITLTTNNNVAENLTFENISSVLLSGRVLYKLSSVPVRDANLLLNGTVVKKSGDPIKTDVSGNFEIRVPQNSAFTLQIVKDGHTFEGDGFIRTETGGDSLLTLSKDLPGVRVWDQTKVRLSGRVVGGLDQASLPIGQGLSRNNLGDHLQLVLELEGDNVAYIVRDPNDLTKDTLEYQVGTTRIHYQHKRIVIEPDPLTGEYEADLFPTKYKVVQATAQGYATLFAQGKTSETIDMSNTQPAIFSITYRAPIEVTYKQSQYGLDYDYCGIKTWTAQSLAGEEVKVALAEQDSTGNWTYLFGAPVFNVGRYQFRVSAHEDYYYNNDRTTTPDVVYLKGGNLKVYNGMRETTDVFSQPLDNKGSALVNVLFDHVTFLQTGDNALHSLDFSVESEGEYVNSEPLRAYVLGAVEKATDIMEMDTTNTGITLLDILRDPPGSASYAYLEQGTKYDVSYKDYYNYRFGAYVKFMVGNNNQYFVGTYAGTPAGGATAGIVSMVQKTTDLDLPIAIQWHGSSKAEYSFTTNQRIQTGSGPFQVGTPGDVYIGITNGVMTGKADAFRIVDSVSYELLRGQIDNRNVRVVQQGTDATGRPWYLMRTEDVLLKQGITSSFAYTQTHIMQTVIPELLYRRNSLLLTGTREDAVAVAEGQNKPVYWSMVHPDSLYFGEEDHYELIKPEGYPGVVIDQVHLCNKAIDNWIGLIATNEAEKVRTSSDTPIQTISISGGVTQSYSESYSYSDFRSEYFGLPWENQTGLGMNSTTGLLGDGAFSFGKGALKYLATSPTYGMLLKHLRVAQTQKMSPSEYVKAEVGTIKFDFDFKPIIETGRNILPENGETIGSTKTTGYVIALDGTEHITFNVYKSKTDPFNEASKSTRYEAHDLEGSNKDLYLFGSLMYRTMGGATKCPWEDADSTIFFSPGTPLNASTQKIDNPQIVINRHEMSNVPHDQAARFTVTMWNEVDETVGVSSGINIPFVLKLDESTNPKGAKISIDGVPLGDGREFFFTGGTPITKTIEVRAGDDYDYEDICLMLVSSCMPGSVRQKVCLSVHYMPVSCNVNISMPFDKWVLNTLSPHDGQGYYMPVNIDGFDVNYDNFDHIELQYKLSTQSNDAWVNLCSYYADDSLYNLASGTKQKIMNGRIEDFRFYGERDPMEQKYDLRAVSFCRHGSGFITRSSAVLTGTKDTRPPRVFGQPEPANNILAVGDNLKLRFNEPIAGNYLDEDNNFQVVGYTNETGITTGTSLHFDGTDNSYAESKVLRSFFDKSFSIDMLIRPTDPAKPVRLFAYRAQDKKSFMDIFMLNNRLMVTTVAGNAFSLPLTEPMTAFTRVVVIYDHDQHMIRFVAGTQDITNPNAQSLWPELKVTTSGAPICLGKGFDGNMMEVRLWSKALTTDEIAQTHMRRLTGYEKELIAYYPMDEGMGTTLTDKANGATLYTYGTDWEHQKGISLHIANNQRVIMEGNLMGRSDKQDETLMFWFKTTSTNGRLFSAGWVEATDTTAVKGTLISIADGALYLHSGERAWKVDNDVADGTWHHFVMTVNRTFNNTAVYLDDRMLQNFDASYLGDVSGDMYLGGQGFEGNIDEFIIFEQAMPQSLLSSFRTISPVGDEMGLMAYLPFSETIENANGIMEQVFSVNDQRIFKTSEGDVVDKVQPLIRGVTDGTDIANLADKTQSAPVKDIGQLSKLKFDWSFNNDELMVNINMRDRQINKQTMYITVRDVEDLNGNPMVSPVTWTAFVDHNSLKWSSRRLRVKTEDNADFDREEEIFIVNHSGKRHQYTIESLPAWLSVNQTYGAIDPMDEQPITLTFNHQLPVGEYSDIIYLTDENGLSEPLRIEFAIAAIPPYDAVDKGKYPLNMSICGRVKINETFDSDENDIVYALFRNECIGMANIEFDNVANTSKVFLTVYGNEAISGKEMNFQLWQASTGKLINLDPSRQILFAHGAVYGCGDEEPVIFSTIGSETQNIDLNAGWTWISTNLQVQTPITTLLSAQPWSEGDLIKNPATQQFCTYSQVNDQFIGSLKAWDYTQMYMVYVAKANTLRLGGEPIAEADKHISLRGDGQWTAFPCLFDQATPVTEALADYYNHASAGDLLKAHDCFAVFSSDKRWEGSLKTLRPGEGYLFRRMGAGDVTVNFYSQAPAAAPQKAPAFHGKAATNMTMICAFSNSVAQMPLGGMETTSASASPTTTLPVASGTPIIRAFIGDELVGVATPIDSLYFLTISSDVSGTIRFETEDGTSLTAEYPVSYEADAHHGSLLAPTILRPGDDRPYKILENNHVVIIKNGEKYDVTGKKL